MAKDVDCLKVWDHVDRKFDAVSCFGPAAQSIELLSARASGHPFSYGLALQASLLGATDGAKVSAWDSPCPLSLMCLIVNPAQTRKSGTTGVMTEVARFVESVLKDRRACDSAGSEEPRTGNVLLSSFTEAALFKVCSGEYATQRAFFFNFHSSG